MPLVVTGTIGIDTVYTPAGEHRENVLGGSCAYFAAAASFYGPVRMVAAVGDDFPDDKRAQLEHFRKIDTRGLETRAGSKTFRWGGKYMENMDHRESLFTELNVLGDAPPPVPEEYADSKVVFLANSHPAVQLDMLNKFPNRALAIADTMDLWIENERETLVALIRELDGLVLNYDEAEQLTGTKNTVAAARKLVEWGPSFVVVKKGEHGCILAHRDGLTALPAFPADTVVDPTGAGDTFAGGMLGHISAAADHGRSDRKLTDFDVIRRSLAHGTVMASFTIESFSLDRLRDLTPEQLDRRFDEFTRMMRIV
ncbi:MAG: PfkB family carbohydrate kinase [Phycisphaerales bacterium JB037]